MSPAKEMHLFHSFSNQSWTASSRWSKNKNSTEAGFVFADSVLSHHPGLVFTGLKRGAHRCSHTNSGRLAQRNGCGECDWSACDSVAAGSLAIGVQVCLNHFNALIAGLKCEVNLKRQNGKVPSGVWQRQELFELECGSNLRNGGGGVKTSRLHRLLTSRTCPEIG